MIVVYIFSQCPIQRVCELPVIYFVGTIKTIHVNSYQLKYVFLKKCVKECQSIRTSRSSGDDDDSSEEGAGILKTGTRGYTTRSSTRKKPSINLNWIVSGRDFFVCIRSAQFFLGVIWMQLTRWQGVPGYLWNYCCVHSTLWSHFLVRVEAFNWGGLHMYVVCNLMHFIVRPKVFATVTQMLHEVGSGRLNRVSWLDCQFFHFSNKQIIIFKFRFMQILWVVPWPRY